MNKRLVTIQEDLKDCGAACLQSIIKYYNGYISMEKIRQDTCISKDGITAYNLVLAAKKYGFQSYGLKLELSKLDSIPTPFIAHFDYNKKRTHYVVVYKINKTNLIIMDPSIGMKKISLNEFTSIWTNICIVMYPISSIINEKYDNSLFNIFWKFINKKRDLIINSLIVSIILNLLLILSSFYTKAVINSINNYDSYIIYYIFLFFFISIILKLVYNYIKDYYINYLNKDLDVFLIIPFIKHIFKLPLNYLSTKTPGEILKRIEELNSIKLLFSEIFVLFVTSLTQVFISFVILYKINNNLTIMLVIILLIYIITSLFFNKPIKDKINDNIIKDTIVNEYLVEYINGIETIKNNNNPLYINSNIENSICNLLKNNLDLNNFLNKYYTFKNSIYDIGIFIINTYGFIMIMNNEFSLLNLITFLSIISYFSEPIKNMLNIIPKYNYIKNTFRKISEFINLEAEDDSVSTNFINGDIKIENLVFSYNNYQYPIKDFNLNIKCGNKVLVYGKSGCGKSTICKLIYRLFNPISGSIKIANINISDYNINTIRENISYISQNDVLFTDTLINNITLKKDINIKKLNDVLRICCLDKFINKLPLRMNTLILTNANNLSGGQKQRIILARTLIKNTKIIILDEALSEVDYKTEEKIILNLKKYFKDNTIIYVSHKKYKNLFDCEINFDYV